MYSIVPITSGTLACINISRVSHLTTEVRAAFDYLTHGKLRRSRISDIYDRIFIGNQVHDFPTNVEKSNQQMHSYFPSEKRATEKYMLILKLLI